MKSTKLKRILPAIVFVYEFKVPATRANSLFVGSAQANPAHAQQISPAVGVFTLSTALFSAGSVFERSCYVVIF